MKEFELISRLTQGLPAHPAVVAGPGDDCALLDLGIPEKWAVFKTDAVVEGIHFLADTAPEAVGHKALGRVLSDFAAAAAEPVAAVITLGLPRNYEVAWVERLYHGLRALADHWQVAIVGGETTTNPERRLISISAIGTVARHQSVRRTGARPGDALFVSGELGGSLAGRHLTFTPRLKEARWLAEHFQVHAMIDLSDGLASDLRHVLDASKVGAEILQEAVPISREARLRSKAGDGAKPPLIAALTDGEDFELLFAAASADAVPILDGWKSQFPGVRLSCVGRITEKPGLHIRDRHGLRPVSDHGYSHFA
ncbi:MAG: thiamine-monophosphate kinase [Verrucomicrobiales bacterium]|nr:thiamine-monophosphate kinase [Verrucomicrobiales bacterium]